MIYGVNNVRPCISKKKVPYLKGDLIDETGRFYKDVVCYDDEFKDKKNVEGYFNVKMYKGKESYIFKLDEPVTEEVKEDIKVTDVEEKSILELANDLTITMLNTTHGSNLTVVEQQNLYTENVKIILSQKRLTK